MAKDNIINKIINKFRDDEGFFQGGKHGRVGGRLLDAMEGTVPSEKAEENVGRQLGEAFNLPKEDLGGGQHSLFSQFEEGDPRMSKDFSMARILALDFDPSDSTEVARLQKRLTNAGYKGEDGKELTQDGKFGPNTLFALRNIQNDMGVDDPTSMPSDEKKKPSLEVEDWEDVDWNEQRGMGGSDIKSYVP